ncbi:MAG: hypothetical protein AVDCRST_MAG25-3151 [uncultured Rubrobacteraceae bacterium]|uniref:Uncharacterized protein n=1 Tax=uncultured Rubrobacteraceae bacterium TaxID=349277 RepID=A0A6J4SAT8_9ACTN|nr:MAG: hypothetical protein AVDCRST_MAG25-3151 [uncultured Rubrobacteraceae bacterium]
MRIASGETRFGPVRNPVFRGPEAVLVEVDGGDLGSLPRPAAYGRGAVSDPCELARGRSSGGFELVITVRGKNIVGHEREKEARR